ncbi:MAG: hypothetical protein II399_10160 [Lachnospiraceae bacterium]|nr:hypothetical protein [Lachnospiraceae bacterium]
MRKTIPGAKPTPFDFTEIYKSKIEPKIDEIIKLCTVFKIPIFVTVCTKNTPTKSHYENYSVSPDTREVVLADDNIQKHLCITLGFDTIYRADEEFNFDSDADVATNDDFVSEVDDNDDEKDGD